MKKFILTILILALIAAPMCVSALAVDDEAPLIYSNDVRTRVGETATVTVKIKNNPGIKAFKLTIYNTSGLRIVSITRDELIKSGEYKETSAVSGLATDVTWSSPKLLTTDGNLVKMEIEITESAMESSSIGMTFVIEDAADAKWNDSHLECSGGAIIVPDGIKSETSAPISEVPTTNPESGLVEKAVDDALDNVGADAIDKVPKDKQKEFVSAVNGELKDSGASKTGTLGSISEVDEAYRDAVKDVYAGKAIESNSPDKIVEAVDKALAAAGASSIDALEDGKKESFVGDVQSRLDSVPDVTAKLDEDDAAKAVGRLYSIASASLASATGTDDPAGSGNNPGKILIVIGCVLAVFAAGSAAFLITKNKKHG